MLRMPKPTPDGLGFVFQLNSCKGSIRRRISADVRKTGPVGESFAALLHAGIGASTFRIRFFGLVVIIFVLSLVAGGVSGVGRPGSGRQ